MNKSNVVEREINLDEDSLNYINANEKPLHDELDQHIKTSTIETAKNNLNKMQLIIKNKNNLIEAHINP